MSQLFKASASGPSNPIYLTYLLHSREIRVVKLLAGQWSDEIRCELHYVSLNNVVPYKALSYAWGSPRVARTITLDGQKHRVTVNLDSALRRARQLYPETLLWVDAICIDQANDSERSHQVALMRDIYESAEVVLIYLGDGIDHSVLNIYPNHQESSPSAPTYWYNDQRDIGKLKDFEERCVTADALSMPTHSGLPGSRLYDAFCLIRSLAQGGHLTKTPLFNREIRAFVDAAWELRLYEVFRLLTVCAWWNRIWVVQEIVVSRNATVLFGSMVAPWDMFVAAAMNYIRHGSSCCVRVVSGIPYDYTKVASHFCQLTSGIHGMQPRVERGTAFYPARSLLQLLRQFRAREATDARDKVYALLGLVSHQPGSSSVEPDYTLTTAEVFQQTALNIILETQSLSVLEGDLGTKTRQDLPSWVPDWSTPVGNEDRLLCLGLYNASYGSSIERSFLFSVRKNIRVSSLNTPTPQVYAVGAVMLPVGEPDITVLRDWVSLAEGYARAGYGLVRNGFFRTLCADLVFKRIRLGRDEGNETGDFYRLEDAEVMKVVAWFRHVHLDALQEERRNFILRFPNPTSERSNDSLFDMIINSDTSVSADEAINIEVAIRRATANRRFFVATDGKTGLGPAKMREGDGIHILQGGRTPFVLRRAGVHWVTSLERGMERPLRQAKYQRQAEDYKDHLAACHELIGDCYANNLMDGDAVKDWTASDWKRKPNKVYLV